MSDLQPAAAYEASPMPWIAGGWLRIRTTDDDVEATSLVRQAFACTKDLRLTPCLRADESAPIALKLAEASFCSDANPLRPFASYVVYFEYQNQSWFFIYQFVVNEHLLYSKNLTSSVVSS